MTNTLFRKALVFTDIHFGRSSNSPVALKDNLDFLDWALDEGRARGCDVLLMLGDWHDNRHSLHVSTLSASLQGLEKVNAAFDRSIFLPGNHDLFYRDRRDIASIEFARFLPNIEIIRQPTTVGDVTLLPWLVGDEHHHIDPQGSRYTFAHLELPGYLMNARVAMQDSPHAAKVESFSDQEFVFSGHFHMRQHKGNVVYTGNVFPFDFADAWDEARGIMILEWGKDPEFVAWPDQPLFRNMLLSDVLGTPGKYLRSNLTARVTMDLDVTFEDAQEVKKTLSDAYSLRKVEFIPNHVTDVDPNFEPSSTFQTVDQIVVEGLSAVPTAGYSPEKLVAIYNALPKS